MGFIHAKIKRFKFNEGSKFSLNNYETPSKRKNASKNYQLMLSGRSITHTRFCVSVFSVLRRTANGQSISFEVAAFDHLAAEAARGESLTARGPLAEAVDLAIFYGGGALGVRYQFGLPSTDVAQQDEAGGQRPRRRSRKFAWQLVAASECSKSCGGGLQAAKIVCIREGGGHAPEKRCGHLERPAARSMRCNARPCPAEWEYGPWGPCSATCGPGTQARTVACRQHISAVMTNMKVGLSLSLFSMCMTRAELFSLVFFWRNSFQSFEELEVFTSLITEICLVCRVFTNVYET